MASCETEVAQLEGMKAEVRRIRTRMCEPKDNTNQRYLALSHVIGSLTKAVNDMRREL